ncbi:hypothetical protein CBP51_10550 [Cellvibrio mixtus]|jgi:hypothetical protein|uniref:Uncharacterized protein n=1 Tax=Cellvibrio mixtus TaxID=39650 RepID=A0A266QBY3_9GAMM|nr:MULTISPECIES: hypothetical protein [Cellvibrio]AQT61084.1 hypothetical protein B0D95_14015 [Cellvibrio sp. PSBB023]OZY87393.1 hypothetical protein CBP51_10550 [Cellvibrio mixtus]
MKKADDAELNLDFLNNYALEDEIYLQLDKLQALTALQALMHSAEDSDMHKKHYHHYSLILEEHLQKLRGLLNRLFD